MTLEAICELVAMVGASIIIGLVAIAMLVAVIAEVVAFFIEEFGG